jgi:hypothetical protein
VKRLLFMSAALLITVLAVAAIQYNPADTEQWSPVPAVVSTPAGRAPSDAVVLFDGQDLSAWTARDGTAAPWSIQNGTLVVDPGTGDLLSRDAFCSVQLHLEWMVPEPDVSLSGQQRSNSGVFLQDRYEVQVLDSYQNPTYVNGQAAAVYKQAPPLVNAMRPPTQWQTYDIIFTAPAFEGEQVVTPAYVTVLHNGVLVQNHTELRGPTVFIGQPSYKAHGCAPIRLQDHRNTVYFRNIWVRTL